jgi:hypothetical protein
VDQSQRKEATSEDATESLEETADGASPQHAASWLTASAVVSSIKPNNPVMMCNKKQFGLDTSGFRERVPLLSADEAERSCGISNLVIAIWLGARWRGSLPGMIPHREGISSQRRAAEGKFLVSSGGRMDLLLRGL